MDQEAVYNLLSFQGYTIDQKPFPMWNEVDIPLKKFLDQESQVFGKLPHQW